LKKKRQNKKKKSFTNCQAAVLPREKAGGFPLSDNNNEASREKCFLQVTKARGQHLSLIGYERKVG